MNSGFQLLQGEPVFSGKILGGCIESIFDMFDNTRYADTVELYERYGIFPTPSEWQGKILLLETSEEKTPPQLYKKMLEALKQRGVFNSVAGVLVGKPIDETYYDEYKQILIDVIGDKTLPIIYNVNVGHATPRCIIPLGVEARVDMTNGVIAF